MNTPCPKCGSQNVAGLVNAFYTPLEDDNPKQGWDEKIGSETELGPGRSCGDCGHLWEE